MEFVRLGRLISSSNVVPSNADENETLAGVGKSGRDYLESTSQSVVVLVVMVAVLLFILTYCLWGTPWCRYVCRRRLCPCLHVPDDATDSSGSVTPRTYSSAGIHGSRYRGAPTIILLPQGRMLVVDGSVIAQFRADTQGVDLMELGQSIAWQRHQSTPSIMSSTTADSKDGISPIIPLPRFSPPSYDSLFGNQMNIQESFLYDLPPSYSEINFQLQQLNNALSREFSNLSQGQVRLYHTSETNLSSNGGSQHQTRDQPRTSSNHRRGIFKTRRFRSVDLLENEEQQNRPLNTKIQSEGDIVDTCSTNPSHIVNIIVPIISDHPRTVEAAGATSQPRVEPAPRQHVVQVDDTTNHSTTSLQNDENIRESRV